MALPTLRIIGFIIGIFLITLAVAMVVPMATLVIFERTSDLPSFLWASMITFVAGLALVIPGRPEHIHLRPRDMYLLTVSSWLVVCIFAALPFLLTSTSATPTRSSKACPASPPPARPCSIIWMTCHRGS